jgi:hypothetical protein
MINSKKIDLKEYRYNNFLKGKPLKVVFEDDDLNKEILSNCKCKYNKYPLLFKQIRYDIIERDGFKCKNCDSKIRLSAHHIDHNIYNNNKKNLICLCSKCNSKANGYYEKLWMNYYKKLVV